MRILIPGVIAMAAIVVASNILVQYPLGLYLTWGALTYPFAFLVTDLTNRLHGPAAARRVGLAGFATGPPCSPRAHQTPPRHLPPQDALCSNIRRCRPLRLLSLQLNGRIDNPPTSPHRQHNGRHPHRADRRLTV